MHLKDFFQALFGIVLCGAVIMVLIIVLFGNNTAAIERTETATEEALPASNAESTSFASELLPEEAPPEPIQTIADEFLTGEAFNRPKPVSTLMYTDTAFTTPVREGFYAAPSRIVVQNGNDRAYVWCEFEYDPAGTWMKQRVFPLNENDSAYEILYDNTGRATRVGIGRKQLIMYDEQGLPREGIGIDREGRYRYFKRDETDIAYETGMLYYVNHTDKPLYRIELDDDLVNHTREIKYYEQRINNGSLFITQHRVIDENGLMRRIVDFSRHDNKEPLLKAIREYDTSGRMVLHREYDKNKNVTLEESFTYDPAQNTLTQHVFATELTVGGQGTPIQYTDLFDRPDADTVRRLSLDEGKGESKETTYHLHRNEAGLLSEIESVCGDLTRRETWTYDENGNWISYRVMDGDTQVFRADVAYCETGYPYTADRLERRLLSLEPLQYAAFSDRYPSDIFWWCSPACPVEERFVRSGLFF
ncbi:MAG: hypothetical protein IJQ21_03515 [Lachnospiraceae bacterium]|nr:hypothetical protein [Lachnospiraceae bacterium]